MLLDAGLAGDARRIVVLQPRRVAARTVAARVAWERNCRLGAEVGYQVRFDDRINVGTRICFVTEGILLRWLQDDPWLSDVAVILFDEFHERNLLSDVALALAKQMQRTGRPDLKIAVMSATMDAEPVARYLGSTNGADEGASCPVLISEGRAFPVEIRHGSHHDERPVSDQAADAVEQIVNSGDPGDILVFMPGMGEINATIGACRSILSTERLAFIPLHGELPPEEQDRAFASNPLRKVVVATNVAETSVTIDGICHVVDSGVARVARFDAERGIGTLFIEPISRASSDQRAGRAGRTAPGVCHRLWTESAHLNMPARNTPEIQRSDLAETVLLLHSLGIKNASQFDWLERPDPQAVERAEDLLRTLGALTPTQPTINESQDKGTPSIPPSNDLAVQRFPDSTIPRFNDSPIPRFNDITPIGRQMLRLPMHPRYSRIIVEAIKYDCVPAAALCAALVSGRDLLMRLGRDDKHVSEARELFEASAASDFYTLMRAQQFARNCNFSVEQCRRYGVHAQIARQVAETHEQILRLAGMEPGMQPSQLNSQEQQRAPDDEPLLRCITAGFIDQLCKRRDTGTLECDLTGGRSGSLMRESVVQNAPLFVSASIREVSTRTGNLTLLGLATAVKREWIEEMFPVQLTTKIEHLYDRTHKRVAAVKLVRFHDLVIHHEHERDVDPAESGRCLALAYAKAYFELPLFNHEIKQWIARVNLISATMPELEFPACDSAAITACLARAFQGLTLAKEAQATPLRDTFLESIESGRADWLKELAPLAITWHDGRKMKLLYPETAHDDDGQPHSPELQVKLHECLALKEHPHICEGRLPVKLWLCAPDGKRIEATFNWPAFKANSYPKLRPALAKKYPALNWC